ESHRSVLKVAAHIVCLAEPVLRVAGQRTVREARKKVFEGTFRLRILRLPQQGEGGLILRFRGIGRAARHRGKQVARLRIRRQRTEHAAGGGRRRQARIGGGGGCGRGSGRLWRRLGRRRRRCPCHGR